MQKIYSDYSEKFLRNIILYGKDREEEYDQKLYYDPDFKKEVGGEELEDLFLKSCLLINYNNRLSAPHSLGKYENGPTEVHVFGDDGLVQFLCNNIGVEGDDNVPG